MLFGGAGVSLILPFLASSSLLQFFSRAPPASYFAQEQQKHQKHSNNIMSSDNHNNRTTSSSSPSSGWFGGNPRRKHEIISRCQCGQVRLSIPYSAIETEMQRVAKASSQSQQQQQSSIVADCHCRACRKFHVSAFCSYLLVPHNDVTIHHSDSSDDDCRQGENDDNSDKKKKGDTFTTTNDFTNNNNNSNNKNDNNKIKTFRDSCAQLGGPVVRIMCANCYTKLATRPQNVGHGDYGHLLLVNLGAVDDRTIPAAWAATWRKNIINKKQPSPPPIQQSTASSSQQVEQVEPDPQKAGSKTKKTFAPSTGGRLQWQWNSRAVWKDAAGKAPADEGGAITARTNKNSDDPSISRLINRKRTWTGSCACGACRYKVSLRPGETTELQHCYCRLCRRLSGGPFQTWIPMEEADNFQWISTVQNKPPPPLRRYTNHGRRHACPTCGGILTIVYDGQEDVIWPAAGSLDDDSLVVVSTPAAAAAASSTRNTPSALTLATSQQLHTVLHICCKYRQRWYELPQDGNPRISDAS